MKECPSIGDMIAPCKGVPCSELDRDVDMVPVPSADMGPQTTCYESTPKFSVENFQLESAADLNTLPNTSAQVAGRLKEAPGSGDTHGCQCRQMFKKALILPVESRVGYLALGGHGKTNSR